MDKINSVIGINIADRSAQFIRQGDRSHVYRRLNYRRWWRLIQAIHRALNRNFDACITTDGWVIQRK